MFGHSFSLGCFIFRWYWFHPGSIDASLPCACSQVLSTFSSVHNVLATAATCFQSMPSGVEMPGERGTGKPKSAVLKQKLSTRWLSSVTCVVHTSQTNHKSNYQVGAFVSEKYFNCSSVNRTKPGNIAVPLTHYYCGMWTGNVEIMRHSVLLLTFAVTHRTLSLWSKNLSLVVWHYATIYLSGMCCNCL